MQIAAMNPQYISRADIAQEEIDKMREIIVESSLNDPATLPKPILNALIAKACDGVWSAEDVAIYEEKKSNMNYLFNFLSKEAKAALVALAMEDKANIVENKIFNGLVQGRLAKQLKEVCLLEQAFVRSDLFDGDVNGYVASVAKALGATDMLCNFLNGFVEKNKDRVYDELMRDYLGTSLGFWGMCCDKDFDNSVEFVFGDCKDEYPVLLEELSEIREFVFSTEKVDKSYAKWRF